MAKEIGTNDLIETWASEGPVIAPSLAKQNNGWAFEEQPPHEYMNWIHNTLGQQINYLMRSGVPEWNAGTSYLTGNVVIDTGVLWIALSPNASSQPSSANTNWQGIDANTFATAAQGALADTALQAADIADFETSAELDARDTANRARTNHTGSQAISTVTGLQGALDGKATAAQGALADTAVQPARQVATSTGLTGGGDLSADRTLALDIASDLEATTGTNNTRAMTPLRTRQAIVSREIGENQVWTDVSSIRVRNGEYQNDTGRPMQLSIVWNTTVGGGGEENFQVSSDRVSWTSVHASNEVGFHSITLTIPAGHWYRAALNGATFIPIWVELR